MFYEFKGLHPNKRFLKVLKVLLEGLLMYRALIATITLSMVAKINAFTLSKRIQFHLLEETAPPPTRKPNDLAPH